MKAWQWDGKTRGLREERVEAARRGDFDDVVNTRIGEGEDIELPRLWRGGKVDVLRGCDMRGIEGSLKDWVEKRMEERGRGDGPKPCPQTFGSTQAGNKRWER